MSTMDFCTVPCEIEHLWAGFSSNTTRDLATVLLITAVAGWVLFVIVAVITCVFSSQIADLKSQLQRSDSSDTSDYTKDDAEKSNANDTTPTAKSMLSTQFQNLRLTRNQRYYRTW